MKKIPIFIISCNRLTTLKNTIQSYRRTFVDSFEIVIHDNSSTYPPLIKYLKELEQEGVIVYWTKGNHPKDAVVSVEKYVKEYNPDYYVVTDPDILFENVPGDLLEYYVFLLEKYKVDVVGPMLRIDDIPDEYPLKKIAQKRHYDQFWHKVPISTVYKSHRYNIQFAPIDSTFGLYRGSFKFKNQNKGIRVYAPYDAKHTDWYLDPNHLEEDQKYYMEHANDQSHWGGVWLKDWSKIIFRLGVKSFFKRKKRKVSY
jgi:glycosyltransferase involved in cell wall biosynthesis